MEEITNLVDISNKVIDNAKKAEIDVDVVFNEIEKVALYNQAKVMKAFNKFQVSRNAFW